MMAATHDGHRKRMRERFRISGLEGFSEHEVLELILFYGRARGNVNDTAHALMDVFGSLPRVLEASPEQLMLIDGIGEESATLLSLILPLFRRYSDEVNQVRSKLESRQVTLDYCRTMMAGYRREQFYVICLTADGSIICNRKVTEGTLSAVTAYPRLVLEAALNSNAHSVVLCHNHPGGVALPSEDDILHNTLFAAAAGGCRHHCAGSCNCRGQPDVQHGAARRTAASIGDYAGDGSGSRETVEKVRKQLPTSPIWGGSCFLFYTISKRECAKGRAAGAGEFGNSITCCSECIPTRWRPAESGSSSAPHARGSTRHSAPSCRDCRFP